MWLHHIDALIAQGNETASNTVKQMVIDAIKDMVPDYKKYALRLINKPASSFSVTDPDYKKMQASLEEIMTLFKVSYFPGAKAYTLQLQNVQKDYDITLDKQYVDQIKKIITEILTKFKNSTIEKDFVDEATSILNRYLKIFEKTVEIDDRIASFLTVMHGSAGKIGPLVEELSSDATKAAAGKKAAAELKIDNHITIAFSIGVAAILFGMGLAYAISRGISIPIIRSVIFAKKIAGGDLTGKLNYNRTDEIGILTRALNDVVENLNAMFGDISDGVENLGTSSTTLTEISHELLTNAENTESKSNQVSAAAEEMSSNMHSISATMEESTSSMNIISDTTANMNKTIENISRKTGNARDISTRAVAQARNVTSKIDELNTASQDISKVTDTITEISEQTNLLALNATIESARAGEAGKGFAVVAGEIKALASQTAEATKEIGAKIAGVQELTTETRNEINEISTIINQINEIVEYVFRSVDEQSNTTREISENITQTSSGINEINIMMNQNSLVTSEITKDIADVNMASKGISRSSSRINTSADDLANLAEKLQALVSKFVL
jgi:methyl-accepting chemotaxis protein